jgi:hypothetical protein
MCQQKDRAVCAGELSAVPRGARSGLLIRRNQFSESCTRFAVASQDLQRALMVLPSSLWILMSSERKKGFDVSIVSAHRGFLVFKDETITG